MFDESKARIGTDGQAFKDWARGDARQITKNLANHWDE